MATSSDTDFGDSTVTLHRDSFDGWDAAYFSYGPDDGRTVIAVHGFPDSPASFAPLARSLAAAGYRVLVPYLPGYGSSSMWRGRLEARAMATLIRDLADAVDADTVDVIGHDWGSVVACAAANASPDRVRRVVLAAVPPAASLPRAARPTQAFRSAYIAAFQTPLLPERALRSERTIAAIWRWWSGGWAAPAQYVQAAHEALHPSEALAYYRAMPRAVLRWSASAALLGPPRQPTLLVAGTRDHCISVDVFERTAHSLSDGSRLVTLDAGHFMHIEAADGFAAAVRSHLES